MSFKNIRGQSKPIQLLKDHIRQSRLASSYLFVGPDGIGKKLVAKTLAKVLNCDNPNTDSCDVCISCLKIDKNQHPDVSVIDASTALTIDFKHNQAENADSESIKIGHIRQLQRGISLKPYEGKKKIFILDNAHNLTTEAANALLKILEEPPSNSLIILISAKPTLLFKTVISRCQVFKFYSLPRSELEDILRKDYSLDKDTSHFLAYFCEGRLGEALGLKDKDIIRDKCIVIEQFVSSKKSSLSGLLTQDREHLRNYFNILTGWFRDIYLIKLGMSHSELINLDQKLELLKSAQWLSFIDLDEILNCLCDSLFYLEQNINSKLLLHNLSEDITYACLTAGRERSEHKL